MLLRGWIRRAIFESNMAHVNWFNSSHAQHTHDPPHGVVLRSRHQGVAVRADGHTGHPLIVPPQRVRACASLQVPNPEEGGGQSSIGNMHLHLCVCVFVCVHGWRRDEGEGGWKGEQVGGEREMKESSVWQGQGSHPV